MAVHILKAAQRYCSGCALKPLVQVALSFLQGTILLIITIVLAVLVLVFLAVEYLNGSRDSPGESLKFDLKFKSKE